MLVLHTTALLLLACGLWNSATASVSEGAVDCCLTTSERPIPFRIVKSYTKQTKDAGCRIEATLIITRAGKTLCAPPASSKTWLKRLIKKVDHREKGQTSRKPRNGRHHRNKGKNGRKRG
ncbi:hypothetical protein ACEWY4_004388 [Coilia grayii]|uniref:Chemokine interleukin-8-like domain-containing protein n=1 Tax=Coilia grayii TaxID=363190 RepID=A0ABD1KLL6_9TELE